MNPAPSILDRIRYRLLKGVEPKFDSNFMVDNVPRPKLVPHERWHDYLYGLGNKQGLRILEIGSREVTGLSEARQRFALANYVGFDYYPGPNVDVVGDVHRLASYFKSGEQFDLIYSSACFEHFAMPWLVAPQIAALLKVGGILFVETHFSYASHERPWNFFQFSDMGLRVLFPESLGFECIEAGMSNPMVGRFSDFADSYLRGKHIPGLFCHSEFLGRKVREVPDFEWTQVSMESVVAGTVYPPPQA
jgi:SAM-dependent methyltransferase